MRKDVLPNGLFRSFRIFLYVEIVFYSNRVTKVESFIGWVRRINRKGFVGYGEIFGDMLVKVKAKRNISSFQ